MRKHSDRTVTSKGQPEIIPAGLFFIQRTIAFVHSQSHQSRSYFA